MITVSEHDVRRALRGKHLEGSRTTSVVMKCFELLVKDYICYSLPSTLDPIQFSYRSNRPTDDTISYILHMVFTHLDTRKGNDVRMLFIDYSSAFKTIVPTTSLSAWEHSKAVF